MPQSLHSNDWLMALLGLLGQYQQAKTAGATPQQTQDAVIAAGLAIATHIMSPPVAAEVTAVAPVITGLVSGLVTDVKSTVAAQTTDPLSHPEGFPLPGQAQIPPVAS